ncbi:MAG: hypothetical protein V7717_06210 [Porticoccaceae bacterium]
MPDLLSWFTDHESALSGIAALIAIVAAIVVILSPLGAGVRGLLSRSKKTDAVSVDVQTTDASTPPTKDFVDTPPPLITDKPSIAVLPFVNMSDDKSQEYFADGMTEDIITGLSCDSRLFVIARNSTFVYKGKAVDVRTVGKELGVRYVLEGSIRPVADRLRITVQLIETETGTHIWADKIDRPTAELFDIMDEVVDNLVTALCANLGVAESQHAQRQRPEDLQAWALCVQSEVLYFTQPGGKSVSEAEALARRASEIEPGFALSWALLAYLTSVRVAFGLSTDLAKDSSETLALVGKALRLASNDPTVLGYCGYAAIWVGQAGQAIDYLERSLAINPNNSNAQISYGAALWAAGNPEAGAKQLEYFIGRAPKDPFLPLAYVDLSLSYLIMGDFVQAEQAARNGVKHAPEFTWGYLTLAMSLTALGHDAEAQVQIRQINEIEPDFTRQNAEDFWNRVLLKPGQAETQIALLQQTWRD